MQKMQRVPKFPDLKSLFYSGVNTTPENERVKALSEACLDSTYCYIFNKKHKNNKKRCKISLPKIPFSDCVNFA